MTWDGGSNIFQTNSLNRPIPLPDDSSVHAILPMSVLEALRNLDTPVEDGLEELAGEMVAKRLGLSATVAAQIGRYRTAAAGGSQVPLDEAVAVFRLAGRRPDAALVFADAGRRAARYAARLSAFPVRALVRASPAPLSRRVGGRAVRTLARRILRADLDFGPQGASARVVLPLSVQAHPDGRACGFYGAAIGELLRRFTGFEGAMIHHSCRGRGDSVCRWRAATGGGYE